MRQQRDRAGQQSEEVLREHISTQLETDVIKSAQSEWTSLIVMVPKKMASFDFVCTIGT